MCKKFTLYERWCNEDYDCIIRPTIQEDKERDGDNYVCRHGAEGMNFHVCKSLKEAIKRCTFKFDCIDFQNLNYFEKRYVKKIKNNTK